MAHILRTRFKKEIVAEFLSPARLGKKRNAIILCGGMPGIPSKSELMQFLSKKGFWVFNPRYRGTWESGGTFLKYSPEKDVCDVIDALPRGFKDLWGGKMYRVRPDNLFIIAGSFGGPAGILISRDPRVKKVVAISPVIDWLAPSKDEPLDWLETFVHDAFGNGYRFGKKEWAKLKTGTFYSPLHHQKEIDGSKLLIFHAQDDGSIRPKEVIAFAKKTKSALRLLKTGGHLNSTFVVQKYWKEIRKFLMEKRQK